MSRSATAVRALVAGLLLTLLAGCSSSSPDPAASYNQVPRTFIATNYPEREGSYHRAPDDSPATVAREIAAAPMGTPGDQVDRGGRKYLRYRHHIVAIQSDLRGGSRIEIESYRQGHRRWHSDLGAVWPAPGSSGSGFRSGGASGGGK